MPLQRFELDRQPVHVPARHELGVAAIEQVHFDENVLHHAVQERSHVDLTVGVRRPVVQDPRRVGRVAFEAARVDVVLAPPRDARRLALGEFGPHREIGFRQR